MKKLALIAALLGIYCFNAEAARQSDGMETITENQLSCTNVQPNRNSNIEKVRNYWASVADPINNGENLDILAIRLNNQESSETESLDRSGCCRHWYTRNRARIASCTNGVILCSVASAMLFGAIKLGGIVTLNGDTNENADAIIAGAAFLFIGGIVSSVGGCYCLYNVTERGNDDSSDN